MRVISSDNEIMEFDTYDECVDYVLGQIKAETCNLYENDAIDKYCVEDIMFDLRNTVIKENGYSHPDLMTEWIIEGGRDMKFNLTKESSFEVKAERKIAHNRFDYDGYRWWNTWFIQNGTYGNKTLEQEMDDISDYMCSVILPNGIPDIWKLVDELGLKSIGYDEYNVFCSTDLADYWIRLIPRRGDYNMYINVYGKE